MVARFALIATCLFLAACAAPSTVTTPQSVGGPVTLNCPSANYFTGLQARLKDIYTGIELIMVDDPAAFISIFNERAPRTNYSPPDRLMFAHIKNQDVGQLYLVYNDCIEGTFKISVQHFKAMNSYRGS